MSERGCGSCTLCCKLLRVVELDKEVGRWCDHCVPGERCTIHPDRPPSCRNFECFWLMDEGFPDDLRPDRCGVVLAFNEDGHSVVMHVDPDTPDAWRHSPASDWIPALLRVYERIFVVCGADRAMIERRPDTPE